MSLETPADGGPPLRRGWLFAVIGVLALVVLAVAYVQWRQYKLLDTAARYQNDALGWSFSQLETEQLRLRGELQRYVVDPQHADANAVQLRYDIFVSRVGLVDHERAAGIMRDQAAYQPAMTLVRAFVARADNVLGPHPPQPLNAANALALMVLLDALNAPLHDLSLGASHLLYERATERNTAVRQQSELGVALTAFQVVLLLALAVIVIRQLRTLHERRRGLEALADSLRVARLGAEAANRAKSAFLANMSHEIRTPFHGMLGMMSLLQDSRLSPKQAVYLDTARESAHHLLAILNDILDISQLESGKLQVAPQTVDLMQLLNQVDALMRAQAMGKGLALRIDVATDVPRWVRADPTRLRQIMFNLLSNALKFTSDGEVVLAVNNGGEGRINFSVIDSGIGMDEQTQARLFQRFMQGDERPSRRASGTGLGLQISRDLARLMGGDITVKSAPGEGSTFTVSLPLMSVGAPVLGPDAVAAAGAAHARPLRVLVAEDHAVNRAYLEAVLEKLGHRGVFVGDGHGAVLAVQTQPVDEPFDVILMDLHMPDMDGFTAARTIRAMAPPQGRVPIVALTADAFQASRELAREAGMEGFLTKPAHLPQLREALQRYGAGLTPTAPEPAAAAANTSGVIGSAALLDMVTVGDVTQTLTEPKYAELLDHFFSERAATLAALRQALAEASPADLRMRAHSLKGAAASLGLRAIAVLAQQLQTSAAGARADETARLLDRLEGTFDLSRAECTAAGLITPPAARAPA
ncbi:MAG: ATP-binding protein [Burkholderiales bacterium]